VFSTSLSAYAPQSRTERQRGVSIAYFNRENSNCKKNEEIHGGKSGEVWKNRRGSHVGVALA
jgi:hypothetical protein